MFNCDMWLGWFCSGCSGFLRNVWNKVEQAEQNACFRHFFGWNFAIFPLLRTPPLFFPLKGEKYGGGLIR